MSISNAEVKTVFSRFSKISSKDRLRLNGSTQEAILRVKDDFNFSNERYVRAIELFLTTYPTGEIRSSKRRLAGYKKKEKKKKKSRLEESVVIDFSSDEECGNLLSPNVQNLSDISSDEWSTSSDDDN